MKFIYQGNKILKRKIILDRVYVHLVKLLKLNNSLSIFNINLYFIHSLPKFKIKNILKDNCPFHILLNFFVFKDIIKDKITGFTFYLESYNPKNMKYLGEISNDNENNFYKNLNLEKPKNLINKGDKYNLIILDNIGGWYLNKNDYINELDFIIKNLKNISNLEIQIRLHPKNRNDINIKNNIILNFPKIKFNICELEYNLDKCLYYITLHSNLGYYYLYHSCIVFNFKNDCFYNNSVLNYEDLDFVKNYNFNNYLMKRDKLFRIIINQSIYYKGEYEKDMSNKINLYLNTYYNTKINV